MATPTKEEIIIYWEKYAEEMHNIRFRYREVMRAFISDAMDEYADLYHKEKLSKQDNAAECLIEPNFREDIAEELSRDELINRICEINEQYQSIRKEWFELTLANNEQSQQIELPSDGEIKKWAINRYGEDYLWGLLIEGAKWAVEQVKQQMK